jgi:hypothetical protein
MSEHTTITGHNGTRKLPDQAVREILAAQKVHRDSSAKRLASKHNVGVDVIYRIWSREEYQTSYGERG